MFDVGLVRLLFCPPAEHFSFRFNIVYQSMHAVSPTFRAWEAALDAAGDTIAVLHRRDAIRILEECNAYILAGLTSSVVVDDDDDDKLVLKSSATTPSRGLSLRQSISTTSTHAPLWSTATDATVDEDLRGRRVAYRVDMAEVILASVSSACVRACVRAWKASVHCEHVGRDCCCAIVCKWRSVR